MPAPAAGVVAQGTAGPAVCVSFVVGGVCAMLSSFIYAEFATELPVAGSSFTYVLASLGQFPAFLVTANMVCCAGTSGFTCLAGLRPRNDVCPPLHADHGVCAVHCGHRARLVRLSCNALQSGAELLPILHMFTKRNKHGLPLKRDCMCAGLGCVAHPHELVSRGTGTQ
jgi:hypothetical protein